MNYLDFIQNKKPKAIDSGFDIKDEWLNPNLFDYQKEIVKRACKKGKYALFVDTGLGKSIMQLNFAYAVSQYTNKPVLILAPLAVVFQLLKESAKFGFEVFKLDSKIVESKIYITNYEQLANISDEAIESFSGIVLDESSILKSFNGKVKRTLIERFKETPYKLACTATPSPNDFMELGNHSEFLNAMSSSEMLSRFFINDTFNTGEWRLKKHAEIEFWEWISSWAECLNSPADLGYDGSSHTLPPLNEKIHQVAYDDTKYLSDGLLFSFGESNATTLARNKFDSLSLRLQKLLSIISNSDYSSHIIWVDTNIESREVYKFLINHFKQLSIVELVGSDTPYKKADTLNDFANNKIDILITKASIAGMGMNFQNAYNMVFLGLNWSYESYYQAVRRMYRFGQKEPVNVHIILADNEIPILHAINRKKYQHNQMKSAMTRSICESKLLKKNEIPNDTSFCIPSFLRSDYAS